MKRTFNLFVFCCIGCFISFVIDSCLPTKTITCEELFKKFLEGYSVDNDVSAIVDSASALMKYRNGKIVLDKKTDFIILSYRRAFHKEFETYLSVFPLRR